MDNPWTPDKISMAFTTKQKELSEVCGLVPDLEENFETSKKLFEMKEAELSLLFENDTMGERLSDKKIRNKVVNSTDYQTLWEDFISCKSILRKAKMRKEILIRELKTLEQIAMTTATDLKYLNK